MLQFKPECSSAELNGEQPRRRCTLVCGVSVLHGVPRSRSRVERTPSGRRHRESRRSSFSQSDSTCSARTDRNDRGTAAFMVRRRLDHGLGQRALQCAVGTSLSAADRDHGRSWTSRQSCIGPRSRVVHPHRHRVADFRRTLLHFHVPSGYRGRSGQLRSRSENPEHIFLSQSAPLRLQPFAHSSARWQFAAVVGSSGAGGSQIFRRDAVTDSSVGGLRHHFPWVRLFLRPIWPSPRVSCIPARTTASHSSSTTK